MNPLLPIHGYVAKISTFNTKDARMGARVRIGVGKNAFTDLVVFDREVCKDKSRPDIFRNNASFVNRWAGKGTEVNCGGARMSARQTSAGDGFGNGPQYSGVEFHAVEPIQVGLHSGERGLLTALRRKMGNPTVALALAYLATDEGENKGVATPACWAELNKREAEMTSTTSEAVEEVEASGETQVYSETNDEPIPF